MESRAAAADCSTSGLQQQEKRCRYESVMYEGNKSRSPPVQICRKEPTNGLLTDRVDLVTRPQNWSASNRDMGGQLLRHFCARARTE